MSETVFTYAAPGLKFGRGAAQEVGYDVASWGARRVLLVTDPGVAAVGHAATVGDALVRHGLAVTTYDRVRVEPTDASLTDAVDHARQEGPFDAVVAVGGGSAIDTAKAVALLVTNPGELMDYVNAPVGKARAPEQPLLPLVAVPTTTGTGSESTTICVLDVLALKVKTGISHPALRPRLAVVDPSLSATQPPLVTAASGMDILCHALESYTARWYADFDAKTPEQRVPYCGANPIADLWSERALGLLAGAFRRAVRVGGDGARGRRADGDGRHLRRPGLRQRRSAHPARQRLPDRRPGP
ncbi:iron-containing alcohol dehydrogenase [Nocardioides sp. TF02-7]|uniref:iron-containing alcohol dehydrogenase n=1 Tax=Nocardioides sp. TF02-7 TaxID=2917724 RepID=UPI001F054E7C|nr:iron-containing alcohol dehydrogenase [Nocardioides sp. TF02-7]UMG93767.1 iron-containing alcohol dehydrogenase [Nocardioides sp. TF02-7]